MTPPRHFHGVSFASFIPNPSFDSQIEALEAVRAFALSLAVTPPLRSSTRIGRRSRRSTRPQQSLGGLYLDGGFGVGKTHLLVSIYNASSSPKAFFTFSELTYYVGLVGFRSATEALSSLVLVAIDEFELDDPGDTVLISNLCRQLVDAGVAIAATSNTLPDRLGEGRFAADDFLREIAALASSFTVVKVDGPDYRHRSFDLLGATPLSDASVRSISSEAGFEVVDWESCVAGLERFHPALYGELVNGITGLGITSMTPFVDQAKALRFVSFVDRLYDRDITLILGGIPLSELFPPAFLEGGFRKKYGRALSRLLSLVGQVDREREDNSGASEQ